MWSCTPISAATMPARRGLAEAGRPGEQQVVDGLAAPAGGLEDDRQVLLQLALADELVEPAGPQAGVVGLLALVGRLPGRGTRHARRAPRTLQRVAQQRRPRRRRAASSRSASRISSGP